MKKLINNLTLQLFFISCLFFTTNSLYANDLNYIQCDSSTITTRSFDPLSINSFKADPEFSYVIEQEDNSTYESQWLSKLLKKLFGFSFNKDTAKIWVYIIYIICGILLIFALLQLVKADKNWFFNKNTKKATIIHEEIERNIHEMDLDELIRQAIEQKQYRRAVRLLYLKSLKELSNKNLIEWSTEKTNGDYLNELKGSPLKDSFKQNTLIFEHIWYGDFNVDELLLQKVKNSFDVFFGEIKRR